MARINSFVSGSDPRFREWMAKVDRAVSAKVGLSVMDLPDIDFASMFADGVSPARAAARAIRNARDF